MSSGAYDPHAPTSSGPRRSYGGIPYSGPPGRRRSHSPPLARRASAPHDSYVPSRGVPLYRDDYREEFPNTSAYRPDPDAWRPVTDKPGYYARTPSPPRYDRSEPETWAADGRNSAVNPSWESPSAWSRPVVSPPQATRVVRDTLFEPSASWKKTHDDRSTQPAPVPVNRYPSARGPVPASRQPVTPPRDYAPAYPTEPGYHNPQPVSPIYRDPYASRLAKSYRPQFDEPSFAWDHRARDHSQPLVSGPRGDPNSPRRHIAREQWGPDVRHPASPSSDRAFTGRSARISDNGYQNMGIRGRSPSKRAVTTSTRPTLIPRNDPKYAPARKSPPRSRSYSRSRSRSLSSSDVASTRASERSSREPPAQAPSQQPQHNLPSKPLVSSLPPKPDTLPSRPVSSSRPIASNEATGPNVRALSAASASIAATLVPAIKPTPSIPIIKSNQKPGGNVAAKIVNSGQAKSHIIKTEPPGIVHAKAQFLTALTAGNAPSKPVDQSANGSLQNKPSAQNSSSTAGQVKLDLTLTRPSGPGSSTVVADSLGKTARGGVAISPPLTSPEHSITLDLKKPGTQVADIEMPEPVKPAEVSEMTTDDDDVPNMSDAKSIAEALRVVVMTRLRCDRQTREERVNPVLMANRSIAPAPSSRPSASPEEIVREASEGQKLLSRMAAFAHIQPALKDRIDHRQNTLVEKTSQLREEYLLLHERWQAHCVKLDSKSTKKNKDVPVVAEEIPVIPASSGRSTRRTAAILGDAVRSDLEMEQIIASLGVEELTDPNHLALRNLAKIPDMISVTHGEVKYLFDDTNNIVDDPIRFYNTSANVESWTEEEREIFLEQFAANPKQFGIIASRLPAKTASQCVAYYYLHKKKHIDFRKIISQYAPGKRKRGGRRTDKQKGNALMADIRQHDDEVTLSHSGPTTRRKRRTVLSAVKPPLSRLGATQLEMTPTSTPTPDPEPEVRKRGRKPAVKIFADDMHDDNVAEPKPPVKRGRKAKKPPKTPALVPDEHPTLTAVDSTESTTKRKTTVTSAHWSDDDKSAKHND